MAEAAGLALPYPETLVVHEATLEAQTAAIAADLPRPALILGGCCCAHVGAIRGLAARHGRLAVVWCDAHGDLNTPETSPSGNAWGMPLRMALDEGAVAPADVALVGARCLDPAEVAFVADQGIDADVRRALDGADAVYVALDVDVLSPGEVDCFMPEVGGPPLAQLEHELDGVRRTGLPLAGVGLTGLRPTARVETLRRLLAVLGL
jgi:arginase